jgi:DNA-binding response OmpR family regulator
VAPDQTVVVVEDDPAIADLLDLYLRQAGYRVLQATSGERGLELVAHHRPVLMVLDIGLPGIDGFQVAAAIRQLVSRARVVLTSSRDLRDLGADRVTACGAVGFVHKAALSRAALVAVAP